MRVAWITLAVILLLSLGVGLRGGAKRPAEPEETVAQEKPLRYTTLVCGGLVGCGGTLAGGEALADVAALVVTNTGAVGIRYGHIAGQYRGQRLDFEFSYLPPGATAVVPARGGDAYSGGELEDARCVTVIPGDLEADGIRAEPEGPGLRLTNETGRAVRVRIFYKYYEPSAKIYIGGELHWVDADLRPGESRVVVPEYFAPGFAGVVGISLEQ